MTPWRDPHAAGGMELLRDIARALVDGPQGGHGWGIFKGEVLAWLERRVEDEGWPDTTHTLGLIEFYRLHFDGISEEPSWSAGVEFAERWQKLVENSAGGDEAEALLADVAAHELSGTAGWMSFDDFVGLWTRRKSG